MSFEFVLVRRFQPDERSITCAAHDYAQQLQFLIRPCNGIRVHSQVDRTLANRWQSLTRIHRALGHLEPHVIDDLSIQRNVASCVECNGELADLSCSRWIGHVLTSRLDIEEYRRGIYAARAPNGRRRGRLQNWVGDAPYRLVNATPAEAHIPYYRIVDVMGWGHLLDVSEPLVVMLERSTLRRDQLF